MRDSFHRKIDYLRISVTDRCNLRCIYCMPEEGISLLSHKEVLNYEEILRIVSIAVKRGITKIRITGGEPLVRKGIDDFIRSLRKLEGVHDISLTTNGVYLLRHIEALKNAGLNRLNVSIDSLSRQRYAEITKMDKLPDVLFGLEKAYEYGLGPIKINVVAIRNFNDGEILDFARLSYEKPYRIRFIEFMPIGNDARWSRESFISADEIRERIKKEFELMPVKFSKGAGPAKMFKIKNGLGEIGFISPVSNLFCSNCNRLRLTADGKMRSCLFSDNEIDFKSEIRKGCTDERINELMTEALRSKPEKHNISTEKFERCQRGMSKIGG